MHRGVKVNSLLTSAWRLLEKRSQSADRAKKECFRGWWFFFFITVTHQENLWTMTTSEPHVRPSQQEDSLIEIILFGKESNKIDFVLWNLQVRAAFSYIMNNNNDNNDYEETHLN